MNKKTQYILSDQVKYTCEVNCVKIFREDTHDMLIISYPEAALWDMVLQNYSLSEMAKMMTAIMQKNKSEMENWIALTIQTWINIGLLMH